MAEINIKLTERQARIVLIEMERIAESSEDAGYRRTAGDICQRIRNAGSRPTPVVADARTSEIVTYCKDCCGKEVHASTCIHARG